MLHYKCPPRSVSKHILLIEDDAPHAKAIAEALSNSSDVSLEVECVRHCSEGLNRLAGAAATLVYLFLPESRDIETFDRLFRAAAPISRPTPGQRTVLH